MAAKNLYEQMSVEARGAVAIMLGFNVEPESVEASGFRSRMAEIQPLNKGFTIGEALNAYLLHILNREHAFRSQ
jgi:hypothetical protein